MLTAAGGWAVALRQKYVPLETLTAIHEVETTFDGTLENVEFGGSTYIAGGVLNQWTGSRCFEVGYPQRACITAAVVAGGTSTWDGTLTYPLNVGYFAVYEMVDDTGARHRGVLSDPKIATLTAATDKVTLTIEPLTISRRHWGPTARQTMPRVIVSIYRSGTPGDGDNVVRLFTYDMTPAALVNDPNSLTAITYVDTGTSTTDHELLYTVGGQLENDLLAGGCDYLAVHKQRLWTCGGADADTVKVSKTFVAGEPAQFSLGLDIRFPGEKVIGMASNDAALIVFTERRIYKVFGDGPDDTGNPATGSWNAEPIATDIGCSQARSIISTMDGVMFRSARGFYLLDRGFSLQYIGTDVETITDQYSTVHAATLVASQSQVRFLCADGDKSKVLVYDYFEKKWSDWQYAADKTYIDAAHDGSVYNLLADDGEWHKETPGSYADAGNWYGVTVRTGWLPFNKLYGRKRFRRMVLGGERKGQHSLRVRYYLEKDPYLQEWLFEDPVLSTLPLYQVRIDPRWQLGQTYSWEFIEEQFTDGDTPIVDTEGFTLTGMSAMVGHLGRLRPMPTAASK